jgi:hypothetical protein
MKNLSHFPKTDIRFCQSAVFRQPYIVDGQPPTLARYKARSQSVPAADTSEITVGSFLNAVFSVCTNRSTIEGYAIAFRKIVADLFGLATDPAKFDYQSGGRG